MSVVSVVLVSFLRLGLARSGIHDHFRHLIFGFGKKIHDFLLRHREHSATLISLIIHWRTRRNKVVLVFLALVQISMSFIFFFLLISKFSLSLRYIPWYSERMLS